MFTTQNMSSPANYFLCWKYNEKLYLENLENKMRQIVKNKSAAAKRSKRQLGSAKKLKDPAKAIVVLAAILYIHIWISLQNRGPESSLSLFR